MMATCFSEEVRYSKEVSLWAGAILNNTKASTAWGIKIWNEWAIGRATPIAADRIAKQTTPLLEMSRVDLGYWMGKFVLEVRKNLNKPSHLYSMLCHNTGNYFCEMSHVEFQKCAITCYCTLKPTISGLLHTLRILIGQKSCDQY